jgi:hypothetical protein
VVSVVVARSGEQSPQPARWIGVFVVVARILDYMCGSAVLDFGKGREVHHRMLGEAICKPCPPQIQLRCQTLLEMEWSLSLGFKYA